ncbi:universal stress protein [Microbacterium halophytorum]|uniref:universal stress protein n=1 Tax=Microbacterium halophytorum TaxID=2067568 RepID=UPI000CFA94A1|nr:universal stress protein [Microbacterium halophytorum]
MSENLEPEGGRARESADDSALTGAVVVGATPGQNPRVVKEAGRYAKLLGATLVVVHVDVTRFVTYEDPDGYVHSAPIDINVDAGVEEFELVKQEVGAQLVGSGVTWEARQLVGDPALALKHFTKKIDAQLIVVGTRRRGFGDSLREFFTGSVAARLSHRHSLPILVVPQSEPMADDEDFPEVEADA